MRQASETRVVIEFTLEERDELANLFLREMTMNDKHIELPGTAWDILRNIGLTLAPSWD